MAKKEKKEKPIKQKIKKIKKVLSPKRLAIIMALIALVSFLYKFSVGIMATSMVLIIAAFPTLFVFIAKAMFAKNMDQTRAQKKRAYLIMMIATVSFAVIFILFSILKVGGIDITNQNRFEGWVGIVFILFIIILFVLSIINLRGALNKRDLVVIGIKEISFVSALADAVMIEDFIYRVIIKYIDEFVHIPFLDFMRKTFPLFVGGLMIFIPLRMLIRFIKYDPTPLPEETKPEEIPVEIEENVDFNEVDVEKEPEENNNSEIKEEAPN